jgi:hypothetical protein
MHMRVRVFTYMVCTRQHVHLCAACLHTYIYTRAPLQVCMHSSCVCDMFVSICMQMCVRVCVCKRKHNHTYTHECTVLTYMQVYFICGLSSVCTSDTCSLCGCMCMHTQAHTCFHTCIHVVRIYACKFFGVLCMCVCAHTCIVRIKPCIHTYTHSFTHTHTHTPMQYAHAYMLAMRWHHKHCKKPQIAVPYQSHTPTLWKHLAFLADTKNL